MRRAKAAFEKARRALQKGRGGPVKGKQQAQVQPAQVRTMRTKGVTSTFAEIFHFTKLGRRRLPKSFILQIVLDWGKTDEAFPRSSRPHVISWGVFTPWSPSVRKKIGAQGGLKNKLGCLKHGEGRPASVPTSENFVENLYNNVLYIYEAIPLN